MVSFHRILGISIGAFAVVLSISGFLLLFANDYDRWRHPQLKLPLGDFKGYAAVIKKIESSSTTKIKLIRFPQPGFNAFTIFYEDDSKGFYNPNSGNLISLDRWYESLRSFIFRLHTQLLLWEEVEYVNGTAGIFIIFVLISGLVLWQTRHKQFPLLAAIRKPKKLGDWIRLHSAWGVIFSLIMFVAISTGVMMVFYSSVAKLIIWATDTSPLRPGVAVKHQDKPEVSMEMVLKTVEKTLSEGTLIYFMPGKENNAVLGFRKRMPGEWHPNGRSFILINPYDGSILQIIDARKQPFGFQLLEKVYPVHGAFVGGVYYKIISGVGALVLAGLSISGFLIWRQKTRKT